MTPAYEILANGKRVADAELLYRVVPFPNDTLRAQMLAAARRVGVAETYLNG